MIPALAPSRLEVRLLNRPRPRYAGLGLRNAGVGGSVSGLLDDWEPMPVSSLALVFAILLHRMRPCSIEEGRWVWVLPILVFLLALIASVATSGFESATREFFHPGLNGEARWVLLLVTGPTCSSAIYSLAMHFSAVSRRPNAR